MSRSVRSVTVIPASINPISHLPIALQRKRRVAGYARVSTDSEEQQTSYEAQVDYYTRYIQSKPDWEFVKVYTDEGITATNTKKRDGFNQMVADALAGKIDLIVTKSVSRFARNTVDSLTTVRKLKEKGVEVYFEKENIYTLDSKGELLITIMSSLAQEESRSISENVTCLTNTSWATRKARMDCPRSCRRKRKSSAVFTPCSSLEAPLAPSQSSSPRTVFRPLLARANGRPAPSRASFPMKSTKAMPSCRKPTPSISLQKR